MFKFTLELDIPLLTVTRSGVWSLNTVAEYEAALRVELLLLQHSGRPTSFIIDIRSTAAPDYQVAEALRLMVARLGDLNADRTGVVTSSGAAKLQAKYAADPSAQVFTTMALARAWVRGTVEAEQAPVTVHDKPSAAEAEGATVHIQGPSDVDVVLTPSAAIETAKRISNAAIEVLLQTATPPATEDKLAA
jgi:hypothetical protein